MSESCKREGMHWKWRELVQPAALLLAIFILYVGAEVLLYRRAVLPPQIKTLDAYMQYRPDSNRFLLHTTGDGEYLEALGPGAGLLASGPSGFVFNQSGKMVDSAIDTGDAVREYERRWRGSSSRREMDRQQADEWIRKNVKLVSSRAG